MAVSEPFFYPIYIQCLGGLSSKRDPRCIPKLFWWLKMAEIDATWLDIWRKIAEIAWFGSTSSTSTKVFGWTHRHPTIRFGLGDGPKQGGAGATVGCRLETSYIHTPYGFTWLLEWWIVGPFLHFLPHPSCHLHWINRFSPDVGVRGKASGTLSWWQWFQPTPAST